MLRANLATRPFYNTKAVRLVLGAAGLLAIALVVFDTVQLVSLSASQTAVGARAAEAEQQAGRLRAEAARTRGQIDPQELQTVAAAAREANAIIDRRAFSWTELFRHFETALPLDVRITAVQPNREQTGRFRVTVSVEAKSAEDLDAFVEALEEGGAFRDVLATEDAASPDDLLDATIEATYLAPGRESVGDPPAPAADGRGVSR